MTRRDEDRLVRKHLPLVRAIVWRFRRGITPNVLTEDLVAAGAMGLLAALRQNQGDSGPTWRHYATMRIRGAVVDELRRQDFVGRGERRRSDPILVDVPADLLDPLDVFATVANQLDAERLSRAVSALQDRERLVLYGRAIEDAPVAALAARLGVSTARISQIYRRAVRRLREAVAA